MTNNLKTVLVTGSNGQLGSSIRLLSPAYTNFIFTFIDVVDLDLMKSSSIQDYFEHNSFDYIINCAAYTAVDKAESELAIADQLNHLAVQQLAVIAKQQGSVLIHISTDYVFDGENSKPYVETDSTNPQSVYGITKLKAEQAIKNIQPQGCIIRTSWVYSEYGNNFVKTMLRLGQEKDSLGVIFDQIGTPTYAGDLAQTILKILNKERWADNVLYHYSNEGVCSWYDFAKAIFALTEIDCQVAPIETKDYPMPAKRPYYSLLNKTKIKEDFNLVIPYWQDSLKHCMKSLQEQNK